jgi:hypothetical protein
MNISARSTRRAALVLLAVLLLPAAASAKTLHLFSKAETIRLTDTGGHGLDVNKVKIAKGDRLDESDLDYLGTAAHHSRQPVGSDHLGCVVVTLPRTVCDAQYAIGGSMLLSDAFTANFTLQNPFPAVPIAQGTGRYSGAHGIVRVGAVAMTNNANFTVTYQR